MAQSPSPLPRQGSIASLLSPLPIAAWLTWLGVSFGALDFGALGAGVPREWIGLGALLLFAVCFGLTISERCQEPTARLLVLVQAACALGASWLLKDGIAAVLSIIIAAQLVATSSRTTTVLVLLGFDLALAWMWSDAVDGAMRLLATILPIAGFQAFAALTMHYARSSEEASARLGEVNAELLATRRLLEESARSAERLKLSRELHDVTGHKLTALKLNLAQLARDPALAGREQVGTSAALADELLADIRAVVSELRRHDGIDLAEALDALVRPIPGTRFRIELDQVARVEEVGTAQALLRCAQEGITNALRHGRAREIVLRCERHGDCIELSVTDDGARDPVLQFGNGLNGMRERLEALGGSLRVAAAPGRGVQLVASLPVAT